MFRLCLHVVRNEIHRARMGCAASKVGPTSHDVNEDEKKKDGQARALGGLPPIGATLSGEMLLEPFEMGSDMPTADECSRLYRGLRNGQGLSMICSISMRKCD